MKNNLPGVPVMSLALLSISITNKLIKCVGVASIDAKKFAFIVLINYNITEQNGVISCLN